MRRALRKLEQVGLVERSRHLAGFGKENNTPRWFAEKLGEDQRKRWAMPRRWHQRMSARLTPLGTLVLARFGVELEDGKPIRWGPHLDELAREVRKSPGAVLAIYADRLEEAQSYQGFLSRAARAFGNPEGVRRSLEEAAVLGRVAPIVRASELVRRG